MTNIADKAILVNLSFSMWSALREDKAISEEVARQHGVDVRRGVYKKYLIDPATPEFVKVRAEAGALRDRHYKLTLPWNDDGTRILAAAALMDYREAVNPDAFNQAAEAFIQRWPYIVAKAKAELNGMATEEEYPSQSALHAKFSVRRRIFPIADPNDMRVNLSEEDRQLIRTEVEASMTATINAAMCNVFTQLRVCIQDMVDRIGGYEIDANGKTVKTFRDTAITNLRELVARIPKLNITGDPVLTQLTDAIGQSLCRPEPQELRDDHYLRQQHVAKAKAVVEHLANIEQYMSIEEAMQ